MIEVIAGQAGDLVKPVAEESFIRYGKAKFMPGY